MTARDLLQQRTTTPEGDTVWRVAPLVEAALEGRLAVLDGLHRAHKSSLAVLQRLVQALFWIRDDLVPNLFTESTDTVPQGHKCEKKGLTFLE
jgi:hypothetical protein